MDSKSALQFESYEDYLDSRHQNSRYVHSCRHVSAKEDSYLEQRETARDLVELGFLQQGVLSRAEFAALKRAAAVEAPDQGGPARKLACSGFSRSPKRDSPLLKELAAREQEVVQERVAVVVFVRALGKGNHEVSAYIDFHQRLQEEGAMEAVFQGRTCLLPSSDDLSFYDHQTQELACNDSPSFEVIADDERGLKLKDRRDRKVFCVDPGVDPGDETFRQDIHDPDYLQVVLFTHNVRSH